MPADDRTLVARLRESARLTRATKPADDWEEEADLLDEAADRVRLLDRRVRGTYGILLVRGPHSLSKAADMLGDLIPEDERKEIRDGLEAAARSTGIPFPGPFG